MKIIDLLNKIANGEEVPKIILFNSYKYRFDKIDRVYRNIRGNSTLGTINELDLYLNDEVEIKEEEKKIPENLPFKNDMKLTIMEVYHELEKYNYKINEIIDYLKSKGD